MNLYLAFGLMLGLTACDVASSGEPNAGLESDVLDADSGASDVRATEEDQAAAQPDAENPPPPLRVLFVGNSYTFFNDLPSVTGAIIDATSASGAEVDSVTAGGATLAEHWSTTGARDRVESGEYNVVVLQGQSLEAVSTPDWFQEQAEQFADALSEVEARGVWFAHWARRDVEASPEVLWAAIEEQYEAAAAHNGDRVARVGAAWEIALLAMPDVALFNRDMSHPSPEGSLLASCVIAQAITGMDPRLPDETPLGISRDVAEALCAIADRGVPCSPEESECDDACVPWSPSACGACDRQCNPGDPCRRGVCGCDAGQVGCDQRCVQLGTVNHCADCSDVCDLGQDCNDDQCVCPSSAALDLWDRFHELSALEPACETRDHAGGLACNRAAHRYCSGTGCFDSGFIAAGHAPRPEAVMCLPGAVRETTYPVLSELEPGCDGVAARVGQACATAIHRFCVNEGFISGFGPVDEDGNTVWLACVADAEVTVVSNEELQGWVSRCAPDAATCSSAAWNLCEENGHTAGFGPVETDGSVSEIVCVD